MPAPFDDITATYTSAHAWMYEAVVASAVYGSRHVIDERFLPHLKQDRSASFEDAERFIVNYTTPRFLDGINLATFLAWIAGRPVDLDDARDLASRVDLDDKDVCRIAGMPLLMISGRRPSAVAERPVMDS